MQKIKLEVRWGVSRGRDTYGYTTCTLRADGRKVAACNGGGYDMRGTVIGNYIAHAFRAELLKLKIPMSRRNGEDVREYYGLTYHDPNYDPGKAVVGTDCTDRTLGGAKGKTVEQAEAAGKSVGLERYQAVYRASSHVPTKKHTIPSIDGGCGLSSVKKIINALGMKLEQVVNMKNLDVYLLTTKE